MNKKKEVKFYKIKDGDTIVIKNKNNVSKEDVKEFSYGYGGYSCLPYVDLSNKNKMNNKIKQIGDKVFLLNGSNKIREGKIIEVEVNYTIQVKEKNSSDNIRYGSEEVFDSKEELIESLSK